MLRSIAGYDVEGELGRGSVGRVYSARHKPTGALRAVKVLEGNPDSESLARFQREARALAESAGPGVVGIHGSGVEDGRFYLVMDLLPGGSLRDRLRQRRRLPWQEAAALVAKLASALDRCHHRGLVHRDVKPENVLFDAKGEPCLVDFGCVHDLAATTITESDAVIGTPVYVAPEQFRGEKPDGTADVYALGIVLYELVTGSRPYGGSTVPELLRGAHRDRRAASLAGDVPLGIDAVVDRALAYDPEDRYETALLLAQDLEALVGGQELRRAPIPTRSLRTLVGGVAVGLALAGAIAVVAGRGGEPTDPRPELARAIATLARGTGRDRATASNLIARAVAPGAPSSAEALAALDAAADAVLADVEIVRLRHQARRLRGLPGLVRDLASLGDGHELEEAARRGSPSWFEGEPALDGLRGLHAALGGSRAAATLHGLAALAAGHSTAALGSGRAALRAEAVRALDAAAPDAGPARQLRAALRSVDRLATGLLPTEFAEAWTEPTTLVEAAVRDVTSVAHDPELRCDASVLLQPLEAVARDVVRSRRLKGAQLHSQRCAILARVCQPATPSAPLIRSALDYSPKWPAEADQFLTRAKRLEEDAALLEPADGLIAATILQDASDLDGTWASTHPDSAVVASCFDGFEKAARLAQEHLAEDPRWASDVMHDSWSHDAKYRSRFSDPTTEAGRRALEVGIDRAVAAYKASGEYVTLAELATDDARLLVWVIFLSGKYDRVQDFYGKLPRGARPDGTYVLACSTASRDKLQLARELLQTAKFDKVQGIVQNDALARAAEAYVTAKERAAGGAPGLEREK